MQNSGKIKSWCKSMNLRIGCGNKVQYVCVVPTVSLVNIFLYLLKVKLVYRVKIFISAIYIQKQLKNEVSEYNL